jgi:hypothetical protein
MSWKQNVCSRSAQCNLSVELRYEHVITAGGMIKRRMASGHYHNCKIDMLFNLMLQRVTFFLKLISNKLYLLRNDLQEN